MATSSYDVAIVGGGHNGLSAACYLAQAGKKVLVIEALDKVGGMATSGYVIPGAPQHLVHTCALDLMSLRVHPMMPIELGLDRHGFQPGGDDPGYVYLHPDGHSMVFWRDCGEDRRRDPPLSAEGCGRLHRADEGGRRLHRHGDPDDAGRPCPLQSRREVAGPARRAAQQAPQARDHGDGHRLGVWRGARALRASHHHLGAVLPARRGRADHERRHRHLLRAARLPAPLRRWPRRRRHAQADPGDGVAAAGAGRRDPHLGAGGRDRGEGRPDARRAAC